MSVKNGEVYLSEQMMSILPQLGSNDELIVCDDKSTDRSMAVLASFQDPRIKILKATRAGVVAGFEQALSHSSGEFIFLADQDDIWSANKIGTMTQCLESYDLVVCDCAMVDQSRRVEAESFFVLNRSGSGLIRNLIRNSYMGCCMAFTRRVLNKALPFPAGIAIHDYWIGLVAELHFRTLFLPEPLVWHRNHMANHSTTGRKSEQPYTKRISQRFHLLKNLVQRAHD